MSNEPVRIALDPEVLAGKPVVRGTRLSVEFVIGLMADGWSEADILASLEFREGFPERSLRCASLPMRIFLCNSESARVDWT